jgi:hypothetical protein
MPVSLGDSSFTSGRLNWRPLCLPSLYNEEQRRSCRRWLAKCGAAEVWPCAAPTRPVRNEPEGPGLLPACCQAASTRNEPLWRALHLCVRFPSPHAASALPAAGWPFRGRGLRLIPVPHAKQQPNGTPGKKPPVPSVKRRPVMSFSTMVEILKSRKLRRADEMKLYQVRVIPP